MGVSEAELQRLSEAGVLVTHHRVLVPEVAAKPRKPAGAGGLTVCRSGHRAWRRDPPVEEGWAKGGFPAINNRE